MSPRPYRLVPIALLLAASSCSTVRATHARAYRTYGDGNLRNVVVKLDVVETVQEIAPGVKSEVWTFAGTVPGPVIRIRQGDTVSFTLTNKSTKDLSHSIDFHAAQTPWDVNYKPVAPGQSFTFSWVARFPGVFMYHCGVPPVLHHIANGMYGAIIVEPDPPLAPAREYVLVSSEYYLGAHGAGIVAPPDPAAMTAPKPTFVTFNGRAGQYLQQPLVARPGELIRLWVMDAGPTLTTAFHVIGALFDHVYVDGNPTDVMNGVQTWNVPPGGGAMFELSIPDEGVYPFVTHSFAYTGLGAVGAIQVSAKAPAAPTSYPAIGDPFSGGLHPTSGEWSGAPPAPAFALKAPATSSGPAAIAIANLKFAPDALEVMSGTKVTLTNSDQIQHDLTIDSLKLKVVVAGGQASAFTFTAPAGTYPFYCSVPGHRAAGMTGTITVMPSGAH